MEYLLCDIFPKDLVDHIMIPYLKPYTEYKNVIIEINSMHPYRRFHIEYFYNLHIAKEKTNKKFFCERMKNKKLIIHFNPFPTDFEISNKWKYFLYEESKEKFNSWINLTWG